VGWYEVSVVPADTVFEEDISFVSLACVSLTGPTGHCCKQRMVGKHPQTRVVDYLFLHLTAAMGGARADPAEVMPPASRTLRHIIG
jgi:hypothetical protein